MKTYSAKPCDVDRKWYIIDAGQDPLGRVSTRVAELLMGKGKPSFTKHIDTGDYVIVINSDSLVVTGKKLEDKIYYKHSKYPGGLTERKLKEKMSGDSREVIINAVRGMLPVNKLRPQRLQRLKVYKGSEHDHDAQKPTVFNYKGSK